MSALDQDDPPLVAAAVFWLIVDLTPSYVSLRKIEHGGSLFVSPRESSSDVRVTAFDHNSDFVNINIV